MRLTSRLGYSDGFLKIAERVVKLEEAGVDQVWVAEAYSFDAATRLGFLAARTRRVQLGSGIFPIYSRTPTLLAQTAAGLDELSNGRAILGLGASGPQVIEGFHGVVYDRPVQRMREIIEICRRVWRRDVVQYQGKAYTLPLPADRGTGLAKALKISTHPVRDRIPIYLASLGERSVELTAELADGWLPIFLAPSRMAAAVAELEAGAKAAGRSWRDITISPQVSVYVTDDVAAARDRERPHIAFYIGGMGVFYHEYMQRIGFGAEADRVREAYRARERDRAAKLVTDEMVDAMTIIGNPRQCRDQMQAFFDAGVRDVRLVFNEPNKEAYVKALRALAPR